MPEKCAKCGSTITAGDTFCGECGTRLGNPGATDTARFQAPTPPTPGPSARPSMPHPTAPLMGEAMPNEHYQGMRLMYIEDGVESLDPVTTPSFLMRLGFHWFIGFDIGVIVTVVLLIVGIRSPTLLGLLWLVLIISYAFIPVWVPISEWKFLVDGKADASDKAFEHIAFVIHERESPVSRVSVGRMRLGIGASRDYLRLKLGIFRGVVSCFPFGRDLYVGWTFWWRISTIRYWMLVFQRMFQAYTMRNSTLHTILRFDRAKALREVIHSAAREGVDAAAGEIAFKGAGTIGNEIPIELEDSENGRPQWMAKGPAAGHG